MSVQSDGLATTSPYAGGAHAPNSPSSRAPAALVPTVTSSSGNSTGISEAAANSAAMLAASASAKAVRPLRAANSPAAASGPGAFGSVSFPQTEQCSLGHEEEEDQVEEDEEEDEDEDNDDELGSDEDLSSWGSDEEIWGSDSDFYNSDDEEEGPMAGKYMKGCLLCMLCSFPSMGLPNSHVWLPGCHQPVSMGNGHSYL